MFPTWVGSNNLEEELEAIVKLQTGRESRYSAMRRLKPVLYSSRFQAGSQYRITWSMTVDVGKQVTKRFIKQLRRSPSLLRSSANLFLIPRHLLIVSSSYSISLLVVLCLDTAIYCDCWEFGS